MEQRNWVISVCNDQYSVRLERTNGFFKVLLGAMVDMIPSRLCCGGYTWRVFQRPVHWLINKTAVSYDTVDIIPVSIEMARKIDSDFVSVFDDEEN